MITVHPRDVTVIAQDHTSQLREDAVQASGRPPAPRRTPAAWLRRAATRLDPPCVHAADGLAP